jgi:hypothetical protein
MIIWREMSPTTDSCTPGKSWYRVWSAITDPMKAATIAVSGSESTPMRRICAKVSGRYVRPSEAKARRASRRK